MDVEKRVKEIIAEVFKTDSKKLQEETCYVEDLRAKSANILELIATLEDEFNLRIIPLVEARKNKTIGDTIAYMEKRCKGGE